MVITWSYMTLEKYKEEPLNLREKHTIPII